jgi:hypothetical protein
MFRQLMWPSSGWKEQEYNCRYKLQDSVRGLKNRKILVKFTVKILLYGLVQNIGRYKGAVHIV